MNSFLNPETKIDLSVCMVTWNACDITLDCLTSLVSLTKAISYEVILVDNGSGDGTVDEVRTKFPQVRLIPNEKNEGFTRANNQALRMAKGRYSILLNNDMLFTEDALSKMVAFMDNNDDVGVLGCKLRLGNAQVQKTAHEDVKWQDYLYTTFFLHRLFPRSRTFGRINSTYIDYESTNLAVNTGWVVGAGLMIRTESLNHIGLLDENIVTTGEDWEWCRRFANNGYRVVYYTGTEIVHYHGISTINYVGRDRDKIRKTSIMRSIAASHYVFRKLNADDPVKLVLFNVAFRLHCLSRAVMFCLYNLMMSSRADYGSFLGYFHGIFVDYNSLCRDYLRLTDNET